MVRNLKLKANWPPLFKLLTDICIGVILNYALTLEHLEDTFYRDGLAKFSEQDFAAAGFDSTFYGNVKRVASDEAQHVAFLTSALKGTLSSITSCSVHKTNIHCYFSRWCYSRR